MGKFDTDDETEFSMPKGCTAMFYTYRLGKTTGWTSDYAVMQEIIKRPAVYQWEFLSEKQLKERLYYEWKSVQGWWDRFCLGQ